MYLAMLGL
ncbi:hypothetical protein MTR67_031138 [Solanum verrucosum]|uniref:Uncharacterized protein n=1 Tax=Solanum verrucosum TaxID=315347 RepID=A0AAF0U1W1_SOLVR|nr:hypothetical protein MTR67_031138 [Solanum verrucosum]